MKAMTLIEVLRDTADSMNMCNWEGAPARQREAAHTIEQLLVQLDCAADFIEGRTRVSLPSGKHWDIGIMKEEIERLKAPNPSNPASTTQATQSLPPTQDDPAQSESPAQPSPVSAEAALVRAIAEMNRHIEENWWSQNSESKIDRAKLVEALIALAKAKP